MYKYILETCFLSKSPHVTSCQVTNSSFQYERSWVQILGGSVELRALYSLARVSTSVVRNESTMRVISITHTGGSSIGKNYLTLIPNKKVAFLGIEKNCNCSSTVYQVVFICQNQNDLINGVNLTLWPLVQIMKIDQSQTIDLVKEGFSKNFLNFVQPTIEVWKTLHWIFFHVLLNNISFFIFILKVSECLVRIL